MVKTVTKRIFTRSWVHGHGAAGVGSKLWRLPPNCFRNDWSEVAGCWQSEDDGGLCYRMRRGYTKTRVIFFNAPSAAHWGRPVGHNSCRRRLHFTLFALLFLALVAFFMAAYVFENSFSSQRTGKLSGVPSLPLPFHPLSSCSLHCALQ